MQVTEARTKRKKVGEEILRPPYLRVRSVRWLWVARTIRTPAAVLAPGRGRASGLRAR